MSRRVRSSELSTEKSSGPGHLRKKDKPIVFHDLRHTFGTLGAAIWPLHDLQGYLGHANIQTTMIYVHHVPKVKAASELGRAVEVALGAEITDSDQPSVVVE